MSRRQRRAIPALTCCAALHSEQRALRAPHPTPIPQHTHTYTPTPTSAPTPAGAKNYPALGANLQKAVLTTLATSAGVCLLWAHVEGLMTAVGQERAIAAGAARFLLLCTPALFCAGLFECLKRYLMAQGVVTPVTAVSLAAVLLAPPFNWALIFRAGLGLDGAAAALVATWVSMLCMLAAYVAWHERRRRGTPQQTWHGWCAPRPDRARPAGRSVPALRCAVSLPCTMYALYALARLVVVTSSMPRPRKRLVCPRNSLALPAPTRCRSRDCLKGLGAYYRLAVPSTLMVCLEWWACERSLQGWTGGLGLEGQRSAAPPPGCASYALPSPTVRLPSTLGASAGAFPL